MPSEAGCHAGTLTQNIMGFVWCSISGQLYGKSTPAGLTTPHTIAHDPQLLSLLKKGDGEQHQHAVDFLTHLAVCNTVVPATTATGQLIYQVTPLSNCLLQMSSTYILLKPLYKQLIDHISPIV